MAHIPWAWTEAQIRRALKEAARLRREKKKQKLEQRRAQAEAETRAKALRRVVDVSAKSIRTVQGGAPDSNRRRH